MAKVWLWAKIGLRNINKLNDRLLTSHAFHFNCQDLLDCLNLTLPTAAFQLPCVFLDSHKLLLDLKFCSEVLDAPAPATFYTDPWLSAAIPQPCHIFHTSQCTCTVALKWNATDKIWDFSTTDVAIWMKQSVIPKYSLGWFLWGSLQDIKCGWFSIEGFIFEFINFELCWDFIKGVQELKKSAWGRIFW